jgi:CDP-glycerol glycerophosphotransferase (TagB/SpsB family)
LAIFLLRGVYRLLTLLPVRRRLAVFSSFPNASDNPHAMFLHLRQREPDMHLVWLVAKKFGPAVQELEGAKVLPALGLGSIFTLARAEFIFHSHGLFPFVRSRSGQTIVNLWHGMPLKAIGTYDPRVSRLTQGDVTIATSAFFQPIMARAFGLSQERVLVTGQPRNDRLVRAARLIEPDCLLWMPTYRRSTTGAERTDSAFSAQQMIAVLRRIDAALDGDGPRLVLKLHGMDVLNAELPDDFARIDIVRIGQKQEPLEVLMARSLCLLTDYSSAAIDYAILRRPIGFYCPDRDDYVRGFVPGVAEKYFGAGTMLTTPEMVIEFLRNPPAEAAPAPDLVADCDDRSAQRLWEQVGTGAFA